MLIGRDISLYGAKATTPRRFVLQGELFCSTATARPGIGDTPPPPSPTMGPPHAYGVVIDAGSSGSRAYVYEYERASPGRAPGDRAARDRLPTVQTKKKWSHKVHRGLATFGDAPETVGDAHLRELVDFARAKVPRREWRDTPIFLLATAGMRLLPRDRQRRLLDTACAYLRRHAEFRLPECAPHVQVISGETEGLYGWIAANYLMGSFARATGRADGGGGGGGHHTYGFLDMGGASAQIAFAPNATEAEKHAGDLTLLRLRKANGEPLEYGVFVTTWLGFGANEARRRYVRQLLTAHPDAPEIPDPCLPVGLRARQDGEEMAPPGSWAAPDDDTPHLVGTGQFRECLHSAYALLGKDKACVDPPCLLAGVHTPAIDFHVNHFVGVSEYWHTTHDVFAPPPHTTDRPYDFDTYQRQVTAFCSRPWTEIQRDVAAAKWGRRVDAKTVEEACFKASWLMNVLHDGIGVPRVGLEDEHTRNATAAPDARNRTAAAAHDGLHAFRAVDEIDGTEVSWTLGAMLLYASSQVAPSNGSLAVGFGSNTPGSSGTLPPDFQYPSGHPPAPFSPLRPVADTEWHDRLLRSSYSRRAPGILIFLLILALASYILCGRHRRHTPWTTHLLPTRRGDVTPRPRSRRAPKPRGPLGFDLFRPPSPSYERVLEAADPAATASFALTPLDDRAADARPDPPRTGRTSGVATPGLRGLSPDPCGARAYADGAGAAGLGIRSVDHHRSGGVGRSELLALRPGVVTPSRTSSPMRSSPLGGLGSPFGAAAKESVD